MNKVPCRLALVTALPLLVLGGCASHDGIGAAATTPASTPPVAAATPQAAAQPHALPAPTALETLTGLQVAQVGLTAQGGLVDVRFKVLDAAKVRALLGDPANVPTLITGDKPPLMAPHHALKGARFSTGQVFYILYPNVRGAVHPGAPVTVAMGPVHLGPVTAQ